GRLVVPGNEADRVGVRHHVDVDGGGVGDVLVRGIVAGHGLDEDRFRDAHAAVAQALDELVVGQDLAAGDAVHVGHQALDLGDAVLLDELADSVHRSWPAGDAGPYLWFLTAAY